ncbi:MAG: hypothetical protein R3B45_04355 [Bdellovibrionota bacterium]
MKNKVLRPFFLMFLLTQVIGCDPEGRKKCVWTLEPEPKNMGMAKDGMIPLCARNRETMKQDCRLQADLEYAKKAYGRKFRYVDLKVESYGIPRTIKSITFCDE